MNQEQLLKSLNEKQLAYCNFNLKNPKNGEYMLAAYHLVPGGSLNMLQAAAEIAAESSTGTNFPVKTETQGMVAYYKNVVFDAALDDSMFSLPAGVKPQDMSTMMQGIQGMTGAGAEQSQ